jgi:Predicted Zn-dependent proteases and their inactivated homologs
MELVQKIELVQRTEAVARDYDKRINRVTVAMMDAINLTQVVTSEGQIMRDTRPMFRMNVHCISQEGDNIQNGTSGIGGRFHLDYLKKTHYPLILQQQPTSQTILLLQSNHSPS